jgi:hypothetical protein
MFCPVCKGSDHATVLAEHSNGFDEDLIRCKTCMALWSVNHGTAEIVDDPERHSFLEATSEPVEADDY